MLKISWFSPIFCTNSKQGQFFIFDKSYSLLPFKDFQILNKTWQIFCLHYLFSLFELRVTGSFLFPHTTPQRTLRKQKPEKKIKDIIPYPLWSPWLRVKIFLFLVWRLIVYTGCSILDAGYSIFVDTNCTNWHENNI